MLYCVLTATGLQVLEPRTFILLTDLRQAVSGNALNSHA